MATSEQLIIQAAQDGNADELQRLIPLVDINTHNEALMWAARQGHPQCVRILLEVAQPTANNNMAVWWAIKNDCIDCVKLLLPVSDLLCPDGGIDDMVGIAAASESEQSLKILLAIFPDRSYNQALQMSAYKGRTRSVKLLISQSKPDDYGPLLTMAAQNGHTSCVAFLTTVCTDLSDYNHAFVVAAQKGNQRCVQLLLNKVDPKDNNSAALREACEWGRHGCIDLLAPVSDVYCVLQQLQAENPQYPECWEYLEQKICEQQKQTLLSHISNTHCPAARKL